MKALPGKVARPSVRFTDELRTKSDLVAFSNTAAPVSQNIVVEIEGSA
jgi:hypothetical protein